MEQTIQLIATTLSSFEKAPQAIPVSISSLTVAQSEERCFQVG